MEKGTTRMHRNRNPCNPFLLVKMASGMDHGRVRLTTTNDDDEAYFPFVNYDAILFLTVDAIIGNQA